MREYKLLVVDDAFFIRNLIKKAISAKPNGYPIEIVGEAKNAKEALELCETEDFDIMTVDYQMPPGENGISLIKELQKTYPDKMFLMVSDDVSIEEVVREMGCHFLLKPFQNEMLWQSLDRLIIDHEYQILQKQKELEQTVESSIPNEPETKELDVPEMETSEDFIQIETDESDSVPKKKRKRKKKKKKTVTNATDVLDDLGFEVVGSLQDVQIQDPIMKPIKETVEIKEEKNPEPVNKPNTIISEKEKTVEETSETQVIEETPTIMEEQILMEEEIPEETMEVSDIVEEDAEPYEEEMIVEEIPEEESNGKETQETTSNTEIVIEDNEEEIPEIYHGEDEDVFTFEEEEESAYEDHNIASFAEEERSNLIQLDDEEKTEDEELADLIKEASYSLDESNNTKPTEVKRSQIDTLSSEDIFVEMDDVLKPTINKEEKKDATFDQMLSEFEQTDSFKNASATIQNVKNTDDDDLVLDLSDIDSLEFDMEQTEEKTEKLEENAEKTLEENTFDEIEDLNFSLDDTKDDGMMLDLTEEKTPELTFDLEKEERENFGNIPEKTEESNHGFDDIEDLINETFENESLKKEKSDDEELKIFDTTELSTSDILRAYNDSLKSKEDAEDLILPPMSERNKPSQIEFSDNRPDGTEIKQKQGFFSKFFKK